MDEIDNNSKPPKLTVHKGGKKDSAKAKAIPIKAEDIPEDAYTWRSNEDTYRIAYNSFYKMVYSKRYEKTIPFRLTNYTCQIVEEHFIVKDSEDESSVFLVGTHHSGKHLQRIEVTNNKFSQMLWPLEKWGANILHYSGQSVKDSVRTAIQLYSTEGKEIPRKTAYRQMGFRRINDQWGYVSASGTIFSDYFDPEIKFNSPYKIMQSYQQPEPPPTAELLQKAEAIKSLSNISHKREIGTLSVALIARAPLAEIVPCNFSTVFLGESGSGKTTAASIIQSSNGQNWNASNKPASLAIDTINSLMDKGHQAHCAIFLADDHKNNYASVAQNQTADTNLSMLLQTTGDQSGRGRQTSSEAPYVKGLCMVTAESSATNKAGAGRAIFCELLEGDLSTNELNNCKKYARDGHFAAINSGYIRFLCSRMDELKITLPQDIDRIKNEAYDSKLFEGSHSRASEIYASLLAGVNVFNEFLVSIGYMNVDELEAAMNDASSHLKTLIQDQVRFITDTDPVARFFSLVRAIFLSYEGHLSGRWKQEPPKVKPHLLGWPKDSETQTHRAMGVKLGYFDYENNFSNCQFLFFQEQLYAAIQQLARKQGVPFTTSPNELWRLLVNRGLVVAEKRGKDRSPSSTVYREAGEPSHNGQDEKTINNVRQRVMVMDANLFFEGFYKNEDN